MIIPIENPKLTHTGSPKIFVDRHSLQKMIMVTTVLNKTTVTLTAES